MDRTASLASSPESSTMQVMPLPSRAPATPRICSAEATRENSAAASLLGPATNGSAGRPVVDEVSMSFTSQFSEALMDQRNHHGPLADGSRTAFDRSTPDVAGGEQPGQVRFEGQGLTRQRPSVERTS